MTRPPCAPVDVVLVGAGHLGGYHLDKVLASATARLVAVVEPNAKQRARALAKLQQHGAAAVPLCNTLAELPESFAATAAIVAAPTPLHPSLALACLARGWHVLVEKPLADTAVACATLVAAARRRNLTLAVGHLERFNPAVRAVLPWLRDARYVVAERLGPFTGRSADTDVVLDLMVHDLDLVAAALGSEVVDVQAVGVPVLTQAIDMASARLTFASGAVAQLSAGRVSLESCRKLRFFTASRYVSVDFLHNDVKVVRRGPPLPGSPWPAVSGEPVHLPPGPADALAAQDEAFFAAVASGTEPEVNGEAGLRAVRLAEAVKAAFQPWPEDLAAPPSPELASTAGATGPAERLQALH